MSARTTPVNWANDGSVPFISLDASSTAWTLPTNVSELAKASLKRRPMRRSTSRWTATYRSSFDST